jgi:hypothetical protein
MEATSELTFSEKYMIADAMLLDLEDQFSKDLIINNDLNRKLVSFQSNKSEPIFRWFHYREGFSKELIEYIVNTLEIKSGTFLDPFAGTATAPFTVQNYLQSKSYAIELMPVGVFFIECRNLFSKIGYKKLLDFTQKIKTSRNQWLSVDRHDQFNHIKITDGAFTSDTEKELMQFLKWSENTKDSKFHIFCKFIGLCILEAISFTRKDGQYLRWDHRSPRFADKKPNSFSKGKILTFFDGLSKKIDDIESDIQECSDQLIEGVNNTIELIQGSCLSEISSIPDSSIDAVITSPPYCNRYDYTRTYALELAYLGTDEIGIRKLRQDLLSCTVENKAKEFSKFIDKSTLDLVDEIFYKQHELISILTFLEDEAKSGKLNNKGIVTMVKGYFYDMTLHLIQTYQKLKKSAKYVMVNDNVRYNGLNIPIDLLLSKIARDIGYKVDKIWVLPKGKGNSSQQMKIYGRSELRKCVYIWSK